MVMMMRMRLPTAFLPPLLSLTIYSMFLTPVTPAATSAPNDPPDPCEGWPCLNGGVCSSLPESQWTYTCTCRPAFTGHNCELEENRRIRSFLVRLWAE
ncbi:hypothetical protein AOLI_G00092200 [Acnodon oligacanthus]